MIENVKGKRVYVGLSGGVDSAVTAALLQRAGAVVTGVFVKGWYPPGMPCTWAEDRRDAMRAAAHLGIGFETLDAADAYKKGVIDYLLAEYAAGRTPNPDAMCNREVKFGVLYRHAMERGADFLATGHYARTTRAPDGSPVLLRGIDPAKDQSYFLWAVPQEVIGKVLFPLGDLHKDQTRALARQFGLPVAEKRDSQGICFLGSVSVEDFLRTEFAISPGDAVDGEGKVVGRHSGAIVHTLGERATLTDAAPGPWYVIAKDMKNNQLTVSHAKNGPQASTSLSLTDSNWYLPPSKGELAAQYRYHGPLVRGSLSADKTRFMPTESMTEIPAAGQSLVLYDGDRLIGGGIIA